ncbi:serine protease hepsin-like [Gigantopelta aegis]|uniref:serine protease hepsin-like n=1 Tax=Gigantopelta aegis TaxID=1735272 RepID=UPI001B888DA6|nr:serine protease hepsin-like [Gigantopelta aegis]
MVHFVADTTDGFLPTCSGVLISNTKILTSKPCVDEFLLHEFWSSKMVAQFADSEKYLQTQRKVTPENVNVNGNLAIVTVRKVPLDVDFCIDKVCLPDENTVFSEDANQKCKTASWGLPNPFDQLQETDVNLWSVDICNGVLDTLTRYNVVNMTVPSDGVCSSPIGSKSSACDIDGGGMLLCQDQADTTGQNWMLAGVTYGTPCDERAPNTFVNVTKNLEFILANMA